MHKNALFLFKNCKIRPALGALPYNFNYNLISITKKNWINISKFTNKKKYIVRILH